MGSGVVQKHSGEYACQNHFEEDFRILSLKRNSVQLVVFVCLMKQMVCKTDAAQNK